MSCLSNEVASKSDIVSDVLRPVVAATSKWRQDAEIGPHLVYSGEEITLRLLHGYGPSIDVRVRRGEGTSTVTWKETMHDRSDQHFAITTANVSMAAGGLSTDDLRTYTLAHLQADTFERLIDDQLDDPTERKLVRAIFQVFEETNVRETKYPLRRALAFLVAYYLATSLPFNMNDNTEQIDDVQSRCHGRAVCPDQVRGMWRFQLAGVWRQFHRQASEPLQGFSSPSLHVLVLGMGWQAIIYDSFYRPDPLSSGRALRESIYVASQKLAPHVTAAVKKQTQSGDMDGVLEGLRGIRAEYGSKARDDLECLACNSDDLNCLNGMLVLRLVDGVSGYGSF